MFYIYIYYIYKLKITNLLLKNNNKIMNISNYNIYIIKISKSNYSKIQTGFYIIS
jgi:hypothetical protein